jgi:hypothetical protein
MKRIITAALLAATVTTAHAKSRAIYNDSGRLVGRSVSDSTGHITFYDLRGRQLRFLIAYRPSVEHGEADAAQVRHIRSVTEHIRSVTKLEVAVCDGLAVHVEPPAPDLHAGIPPHGLDPRNRLQVDVITIHRILPRRLTIAFLRLAQFRM